MNLWASSLKKNIQRPSRKTITSRSLFQKAYLTCSEATPASTSTNSLPRTKPLNLSKYLKKNKKSQKPAALNLMKTFLCLVEESSIHRLSTISRNISPFALNTRLTSRSMKRHRKIIKELLPGYGKLSR